MQTEDRLKILMGSLAIGAVLYGFSLAWRNFEEPALAVKEEILNYPDLSSYTKLVIWEESAYVIEPVGRVNEIDRLWRFDLQTREWELLWESE